VATSRSPHEQCGAILPDPTGSRGGDGLFNQKSMQRPAFSQSPKRVGSGPGGPPTSTLLLASAGEVATGCIGSGWGVWGAVPGGSFCIAVILPDRSAQAQGISAANITIKDTAGHPGGTRNTRKPRQVRLISAHALR
jgi:hypothetical protein